MKRLFCLAISACALLGELHAQTPTAGRYIFSISGKNITEPPQIVSVITLKGTASIEVEFNGETVAAICDITPPIDGANFRMWRTVFKGSNSTTMCLWAKIPTQYDSKSTIMGRIVIIKPKRIDSKLSEEVMSGVFYLTPIDEQVKKHE